MIVGIIIIVGDDDDNGMIVGLHAGEDKVGFIVRSSVALGDTNGTMVE